MRATQRKRPQGQLRQGQLITTFGPGAMTDLPERSVLIAGLEDWIGERDLISEPRLSAKIAHLLQIPSVRLETPPSAGDIDDQRITGVRAYRFPEWFVSCTAAPSSHEANQFSFNTDRERPFGMDYLSCRRIAFAFAFAFMMAFISSKCRELKSWLSTPTSIESESGSSGRLPCEWP